VLLEELLSSIDTTALLVIGAYRSAEVDAAHPLTALVTRLVQRGVELERIELGPLDISATSGMLAEALGRPPESLRELALLVERKTGNNPLLARQFLEHLHEHGWLRHERGVGWTWDVVQIEAADVPDGAVALLTAKIERLAPAPRAALEFASCVSHEFDADLLAELSDQPRASLEAPLFALVQEGLIAPAPGGLRFAHDRIREAARARLSDEERGRLHARTACLLIERTTESERVQRVFEIVDHLERGLAHLPGELRLTTIELHVMAGKVALACGVGAIAAHYFSVARGLLQERDWDERRSLVFELWTQSAESAFQCRELEAALALLDEVEPRARSGMEFAQVAARRILVLALARPAEDGARYVLAALRRLGIRWSLRPSRLRTRIMLRVLAWRLGSAEHPVLKPATTPDLDAVAAMLVISSAGGVLSRADLQLVALGVGYVLRGFLRSGYVAPPAYAIGAFALYAYLVLGDVPLAERHTRHALYWSERVPHALYGNRAEIALQLTLRPWLERRRDALRHSSRLVEQARETGDREFEYYTRFLDATYRALAGDPVPQAEQRLRELAEDVQSSTHIYTEPEVVYGVYKLLYACPSESEIERGATDLEATLRGGSASAEVYARTLRCMVLCVYGRYDLAFAQSETLGKRLFRVAPFVHVADHTFYRGLAAAELATLARGRARWRLRRALGTSLRRLRFWAKAGPDFVHMVQFLEAESARLRGRLAVARSLYERAAQRARQQEFPHHAALAHERRGRMLAAQRRGTEASAAIREAIALYRLWGARDKADALEAEAAS
jgi:hypothetical protein